MVEPKILELSDTKKWNEYLKKLPINQQDIYFTPEYYQLYEELGDGKARCFICEKEDSIALYPFLINSVNDLGYYLDKPYFDIQGAYGYNGIISNDYSDSFRAGFYKVFNNFCLENNIIAEFTRFHPLINNKLFSENYLEEIFNRKTVYIDLEKSFEEIFSHFSADTRRRLRRASKRGRISVKHHQKEIGILNTFCDIYYETMTRINAIPYLFFNKQYFKSILENTNSRCIFVFDEDIPIAVALIFYNKFYIEGHLTGSLTDYRHIDPSSLIYQEIIKFGQSLGCKYFHIGGGSTNAVGDTLLKFKLNFSNLTADFILGKKIHNENVYCEVIKQWEEKNPALKEKYKNILLKYRFFS